MSRKSGFYWVLPKTDEFGWTIGMWYSNIEKWEVIGFTYSYDSDFAEIDPNLIVREEGNPRVQVYVDGCLSDATIYFNEDGIIVDVKTVDNTI